MDKVWPCAPFSHSALPEVPPFHRSEISASSPDPNLIHYEGDSKTNLRSDWQRYWEKESLWEAVNPAQVCLSASRQRIRNARVKSIPMSLQHKLLIQSAKTTVAVITWKNAVSVRKNTWERRTYNRNATEATTWRQTRCDTHTVPLPQSVYFTVSSECAKVLNETSLHKVKVRFQTAS